MIAAAALAAVANPLHLILAAFAIVFVFVAACRAILWLLG